MFPVRVVAVLKRPAQKGDTGLILAPIAPAILKMFATEARDIATDATDAL